MIVNDKTRKETVYKLENIIEKVEEGGYGEEVEEIGGFDIPSDMVEADFEGDEIYDQTEAEEAEEEYAPEVEPDEEDEKEYIREASEIGPSIRLF